MIVDSTPLSQAESYGGRYRIHGPSHIDTWERLQRAGVAPVDVEYDEVPRGRVHYDAIFEKWTILADRCILGDDRVMREIRDRLGMPGEVLTDRDPHYRCPSCMRC